MKNRIATIAAAAALSGAIALPATAAAEYYIPPGNSAVNQYTESFPGAGGETSGHKRDVVPAETLGAGNAKALQKKGQSGKEAAEVAAETAPPAELFTESSANGAGETGGKNQNRGQNDSGGNGQKTGGGNPSGGTASIEQPSGSSGVGSVVSQATGTGDGIGLWLPLAIVATVIGAAAYRLRHRDGQPA